ncbi:MAG: hypothetical protein JNJ60_16015 [Rhodocyclaceae bacterium]|nr:hypothetical protein [Rhodocyclaceae bacterium]
MFDAFMKLAQESARQMQDAHARLLQAVPAAAALPAKAASPVEALGAIAPVQKLNAYHGIAQNMLARQARLLQDLWTLAARPQGDVSLVAEMLQLQQAIFQRLASQQAEAMKEFMDILSGAGHIRNANTVSKLMEEEYDFFAQLQALATAQATACMELAETAQVNAGYLISRRVPGK